MAKYQRYAEYKDSGVEWLGEIPKDWETKPLKHLCTYNDEILSDSTNKEFELEYVDIGSVSSINGITNTENMVFENAPSRAKRIVQDGDVIISTVRTYLEAIVPINNPPKNMIVSTGFAVIRPNRYLCKGYAAYCLRAKGFIKEVVSLSVGVSYPAINATDLVGIKIPSLPLNEQTQIANFLDHETAKIDTLIDKQQTLIKLLKEKRQAVISHAVTANKDEKLIKLGYFVDILSGYPFPSKGYQAEAKGNVALLRGINVGVDALKWEEIVWWSRTAGDGLEQFELKQGDIVFGMDRPWISSGTRVAEVTEKDLPCLLLQRVVRIRANANTYQPFIKLCLASNEFKASVEADLTGVSVPHISPDQIKRFLIRNISYEQQKVITNDVYQKIETLDLIENSAEQAIQLMQERRTALISAAVTGKIDVRGWRAVE